MNIDEMMTACGGGCNSGTGPALAAQNGLFPKPLEIDDTDFGFIPSRARSFWRASVLSAQTRVADK